MVDSAKEALPKHIGIIMDGNGRWARSKGLTRIQGHRKGGQRAIEIAQEIFNQGVKYLSLYVFSVDNWKRPQAEVDALMRLLATGLKKNLTKLASEGIRFRFLGERSPLPDAVLDQLTELEQKTAGNTRAQLMLALNYGARQEVLSAVKAYVKALKSGSEQLDQLDWNRFTQYLHTAGVPDVDLVIRTSGETRLSDFLLLQSAYAELFFSPIFWPDFSNKELHAALEFYKNKQRCFGQIREQIHSNVLT